MLRALEERYVTAAAADKAIAAEASAITQLVRAAHHEGLPIAVSNGHTYLPLAFYSLRADSPFVYLTSREAAARHSGSDTIELNLQRVAPLLRLNVRALDEFTSAHDQFLVYAGMEIWDWLPTALQEKGFTLRVLAESPSRRQQLMRAELPSTRLQR